MYTPDPRRRPLWAPRRLEGGSQNPDPNWSLEVKPHSFCFNYFYLYLSLFVVFLFLRGKTSIFPA